MYKVLSLIVFLLLFVSCSELNIGNITCSKEEDCPIGSFCTNTSKCKLKTTRVENCANRCKINEVCKNNICEQAEFECSESSSCSELKPICDLNTKTCVECLNSSDCSTGHYCDNFFCKEKNTSTDCDYDTDDVCEGNKLKKCTDDNIWEIETCSSNENCVVSAGEASCVLKSNNSCSSNNDCNQNKRCIDGECSALWKSISLGEKHSCAIKETGELFCWGSNEFGQVVGSDQVVNTPQRVGEKSDWVLISSGKTHTCGIRSGLASGMGELYCWGSNSSSELGLNSSSDPKKAPKKVGMHNRWISVSSGDNYTCGIMCKPNTCTQRDLYCWGKNTEKQLGNGNSSKEDKPKIVKGQLKNVLKVTTGVNHTCVIDETGSGDYLYCWGKNQNKKLGKSQKTDLPLLIDDSSWDQLSASANNTCGIKFKSDESYGYSYCWGSDKYGQLGRENNEFKDSFEYSYGQYVIKENVDETEKNIFENIQSGFNYSCGIYDSKLYCWGDNSKSQLANEELTSNKLSIAKLVPLDTEMLVTDISVNKFSENPHTCSIINKSIYCWGSGDYGQLGNGQNGTNTLITSPQRILEN